jgi:hypothetical protein
MLMLIAAAGLLLAAAPSWAAVGCELNDPDRDVKRFFPESTGYRTSFTSIAQRGGAALKERVEERLGDPFTGLYESADVPYTIYEILKGKERIGWIHGVNQKGQFGGIQVFLALSPDGVIRAFYLQKLTSQYGRELRDPAFAARFVGLVLADFAGYDVRRRTGSGKAASIANPAPQAEADFRAILRGAKKNLILMDEFVVGKGGRP